MSETAHFVAVAEQAAREAGKILVRGFASEQDPETKNGLSYDLVTIYDRLADERIRQVLGNAFPEHGLVTEESGQVGDPDSSLQWIVDPLDGTTNFAHGDPSFCVSIALLDGADLPLVAVVYDPTRDQLYSAVRGQGARRDGEPIHVSTQEVLELAIVHVTTPFRAPPGWYEHLQAIIAHGIRHHGSSALELAQVSSGAAEAIWGRGPKLWDIAAGVLLVAEAGGRVSGYDGGAWGQQEGLLATNGLVHDEVLRIIQGYPVLMDGPT